MSAPAAPCRMAVRVEYSEPDGELRLFPEAEAEPWEQILGRHDGQASPIVALIPGLEHPAIWRIVRHEEVGSGALEYYLVAG